MQHIFQIVYSDIKVFDMVRPLSEIPQYYQHIRPEVVSAVPKDALNILDVGCGSGMLGKLLKEQNPLRRVVGIELNDEAAYHAQQHLDLVYKTDLDSATLVFGDHEFDCIIFADVLEHLKDPWTLTRQYTKFLKPSGIVIASIPNIRYLPILREIAEQGKWDYQEEGILDRTHLRFFTQTTFIDLLNQANILAESVTLLGGEHLLCKLIPRGDDRIIQIGNLALLNVSDEDIEELCAYQFLFSGRFYPEQNIINIQKSFSSIRYYRGSVVVPWWDHTEWLEIWERNITYLQDSEVIFVDNGSSQSGKLELEIFCKRHDIKLIRNEENRGYAAANNQGSAIATGTYILFLNNDVEILRPPVQTLCRLAKGGLAGPGPLGTETGEVCIEGWALCITKFALQEIGGWSEDYGLGYWDDVDLCYRAKLAGYSMTYVPELVSDSWIGRSSQQEPGLLIRHAGFTTSRDGRLDQKSLNNRNSKLFTEKFYPQLKNINLIIFPDWEQSEELLAEELLQLFQTLLLHPDRDRISLLIDNSGIDEEDANLILSGVMMHLCLSGTVQMNEEFAFSILGNINQIEWEPILLRLYSRVALGRENKFAVANSKATHLPAYSIHDLSKKRAIQLKTGQWKMN